MAIKESKQASTDTLLPRASRNRFQSGLRKHLRTNVCLALATLVWNGGVLCLMCCASEPSVCCSSGFAEGSKKAIALVNPPMQPAKHSCCERRHESQDAPSESLLKPKDTRQCCLLGPQTSPAALLQLSDHRIIASNQAQRRVGIETTSQTPGFIWHGSLTNRGSTYLLCCVLLI